MRDSAKLASQCVGVTFFPAIGFVVVIIWAGFIMAALNTAGIYNLSPEDWEVMVSWAFLLCSGASIIGLVGCIIGYALAGFRYD